MASRRSVWLTLTLLLLSAPHSPFADTHYVSKTGLNQYPYDSWATAADTVARAVEAAAEWDTILIAAGHYVTDTIRMKRGHVLIGVDIDSVFLDTLPLAPTISIQANDSCEIRGVTLKGVMGLPSSQSFPSGAQASQRAVNEGIRVGQDMAVDVARVRFDRMAAGVSVLLGDASGAGRVCRIDSCEFSLFTTAIFGWLAIFDIHDCSFTWDSRVAGAVIDMDVCALSISNCRFYGYDSLSALSDAAAVRCFDSEPIVIRNNLFFSTLLGPALKLNWDGYTDSMTTGIVENNTFVGCNSHLLTSRPGFVFRNNISTLNKNSVVIPYSQPIATYSLTWNNSPWDGGVIRPGDTLPNDLPGNSNNRNLDPMFVDTIDYLLQAYSPAIDAGDPTILDADGARSDIGYTGGPGGSTYVYQDFAPAVPRGFQGEASDTAISLGWRGNHEADLDRYEIEAGGWGDCDSAHCGVFDVPATDSSFVWTHWILAGEYYFTFRIRAVDAQANASPWSSELVFLEGDVGDDAIVPAAFSLQPNYPNPFNAQTRIEYVLPQPANVTLAIYDVLGRKIETLVEGPQAAGEHALVWDAEDRGSGVYFLVLDTLAGRRVRKALLLK